MLVSGCFGDSESLGWSWSFWRGCYFFSIIFHTFFQLWAFSGCLAWISHLSLSIRLAPQDALCTTLREDLNGTQTARVKRNQADRLCHWKKKLPLPNRVVFLLVPMKDVLKFSFASSWSRSSLCQDLFVTSWIKQLTKDCKPPHFHCCLAPKVWNVHRSSKRWALSPWCILLRFGESAEIWMMMNIYIYVKIQI